MIDMASAQLGSLAGMASAQLGSLIRVQTGGHKASLWTLDSCECSMCTHVIIRPPLPILPYMLPTIRGQHHTGGMQQIFHHTTNATHATHFESPPTHSESPTQIRSIQNKHGPHMVYVL